jgi:hypothetical protein
MSTGSADLVEDNTSGKGSRESKEQNKFST